MDAPMARLFHVPLSPFCRKVRLSLAEKKVEVELVEERYWEEDPDFMRRNPAGKVPVLKIDGVTMAESAAICEYIEETRPEPALMPKDPVARQEVRRLVGWFDDKFHHEVTSKLLYERVNKKVMKQGYPDSGNVKAGAKAIKYHLDYMTWLLDHRRWLAGDVMTLADFAAAAHLSALDYISDVDWNRSEVVKDWYAKIKSRPAFRSILADQVPGFPPPKHYNDLDF
jgi:glutathione S-transferase